MGHIPASLVKKERVDIYQKSAFPLRGEFSTIFMSFQQSVVENCVENKAFNETLVSYLSVLCVFLTDYSPQLKKIF